MASARILALPQVAQRTPLWDSLRRARVCASWCREIFATEAGYNRRLAQVTAPSSYPPNAHMQRGITGEPLARDLLSREFGEIKELGMVYDEDNAASPDGVFCTMGQDGMLLEIKCPSTIRDKMPSKTHMDQMQMQMWMTGATRCMYAQYQFDSEFKVVDLSRVVVPRDPHWWDDRVPWKPDVTRFYVHAMFAEQARLRLAPLMPPEPGDPEAPAPSPGPTSV